MGNVCRKGEPFDPGSVIDKVIASKTASEECVIYRLANYKKGGELVDCFNKGGSKEVERFIREKLSFMMYNHGRGEFITRTEYLRWKFRDNQKVSIGHRAKNAQYDPLFLWEDHEACMKMQYRGAMGESLLHVLLMCDTLVHSRIARILLKVFPRLAIDKIEGEEYLGTTGLHLALAFGNDELAQVIIECGVNIHERARGTFYLPRDQAHDRPKKVTTYEGLAYLGEYHLAWAACQANESIYNLLLESGADPDAQDNFGNTVLHMVVITDRMGMFGYALRHPLKSANADIANNAGLTSLTLSCFLGRDLLFREMLELSCKEFWRYSNICCSAYPLGALDSIRPSGQTNWGSAMMIILAGTKEEHLNMLEGGIIAKLLEEKWVTFAENFFVIKIVKIWLHLICLSFSVYLRGDIDTSLLTGIKEGTGEITNTHITRYCFEIAALLGCLEYVIIQQGEEIKNSGISSFYRNLKGTPAKLIYTIGNLCMLFATPFRFLQLTEDEAYWRSVEEILLLLAVPSLWFYLMFFAGAIKLTGPFVTMVFSMITGDMFTFSIIYIIILFGFSQAFYFLQRGVDDAGLFKDYHTTWVGLFHMTLGEYSYERLNQAQYSGVAKLFFIIFQVVMPILLLNMLIAMMGNTYAIVNEKSEKEYLKQWAKVIMSMERSVPPDKAKDFLETYSIKLGPNLRGVMVIKSKDKTRASQRKGALANWKKTGKTVIRYLKKRKMTGDDLRREMWVNDEAETPKAARKKKGKGYDVSELPGNGSPDSKAKSAAKKPEPEPQQFLTMGGQHAGMPPGMIPGQAPGPVLPPAPPAVVPPPLPGQEKMKPADRFVAQQMVVLQQYYQLMVQQQEQMKKQGKTDSNSQPESAMMGLQPAFIGPDPHTLGANRSRKKTREEIQQDMFLRKRSRKHLRSARSPAHFDIDGLPFEEESDEDSIDEGFFMPRNKSFSTPNGGLVNGGFRHDDEKFLVEDEEKKKKKKKKKEKAVDKEEADNGDEPAPGEAAADEAKEKKKKKKEKKEKKKKKKKDKDDEEEA